jgi:hypothetical protein
LVGLLIALVGQAALRSRIDHQVHQRSVNKYIVMSILTPTTTAQGTVDDQAAAANGDQMHLTVFDYTAIALALGFFAVLVTATVHPSLLVWMVAP